MLVGRFGAAHGLRGELRVQSFTADPMAIAAYGPLTDKTGARAYRFDSLRPIGKGVLIARVAGVADRTAAEALTNVELFADRANMPVEDEDEFYVADLIGIVAVDPSGAAIGEIVDVANYGAGDILEVAPAGGGETLLFAFTKAIVPEVDLAARRVVIAPPDEVDTEKAEPTSATRDPESD